MWERLDQFSPVSGAGARNTLSAPGQAAEKEANRPCVRDLSGRDRKSEGTLGRMRIHRNHPPIHFISAGFESLLQLYDELRLVGGIADWLADCDRRPVGTREAQLGELRLHALAEIKPDFAGRLPDRGIDAGLGLLEVRMCESLA